MQDASMNNGDDLVNHWLQDLKTPNWQEFTYLSEPADCWQEGDNVSDRPLIEDSNRSILTFSLATTQNGDRVQIVALNCGGANNRLMGMGLMPGVALEVISSTPTGSVIVALHHQRLGLGAEMARQIQVTPVATQLNTHADWLCRKKWSAE
jgi:ferrous iron transport protein A